MHCRDEQLQPSGYHRGITAKEKWPFVSRMTSEALSSTLSGVSEENVDNIVFFKGGDDLDRIAYRNHGLLLSVRHSALFLLFSPLGASPRPKSK